MPTLQHLLVAGIGPVSAARVVVASALLLAPDTGARAAGLPEGSVGRGVVRAVAVRELALGAGTLLALTRGSGVRQWVAAQGLVDLADALIVVGAVRTGRQARGRGLLTAGFAAVGAVVEAATWRALGPADPSDQRTAGTGFPASTTP